MSPWLFNVYMDGVVQEANARMLGKGLIVNVGRLEIDQLLFADDTALLADSGLRSTSCNLQLIQH